MECIPEKQSLGTLGALEDEEFAVSSLACSEPLQFLASLDATNLIILKSGISQRNNTLD